MSWIGLLASLALLIVALLCVPLTLRFSRMGDSDAALQVDATWGFGLIRWSILPGDEQQQDHGKRSRQTAAEKSGALSIGLRMARQRSLRRRLWRFFGDVWRAIGKQNVWVTLRIGLDDPADTGKLWGLLGPLAGLLNRTDDIALQLQPEFSGETFSLHGAGDVRIVPLRLLMISVGLAISPVIWQSAWRARRRAGE